MGKMDEYKLTHGRPTDELEHDDTALPETKRVLPYGWDGTNKVRLAVNTAGELKLSSLVPEKYDYIALTYTGSNLTSVVYKTGGSGGTTVATLTLAYTGSQLDSITRS